MRISTAGMHNSALASSSTQAPALAEDAEPDRNRQAHPDSRGRSVGRRARARARSRARRIEAVRAQRRRRRPTGCRSRSRRSATSRSCCRRVRDLTVRGEQRTVDRCRRRAIAAEMQARLQRAGGHREPQGRQRRISVLGLSDAHAAVRRSPAAAWQLRGRPGRAHRCRRARRSTSRTDTRASTSS